MYFCLPSIVSTVRKEGASSVVCNGAPNPQLPVSIPLSLIRLSDIRVHITAKGGTDDKAGVIFPVK